MKTYITLIVLTLLLLGACTKDPSNKNKPYQLVKPDHFPELVYQIDKNPITKEGFELGKKLFNDPMLSLDHSIACSNCHVKGVAFTDPQHNPSIGIYDQQGTRNAPMVANLAFQTSFLLDGGIHHLDFVPIFALENSKEMGESIEHVITKINDIPEYQTLFREAFEDLDTITAPRFLQAFSQYMLLLVSDNAKYDQVQRSKAAFTSQELAGQKVFDQKCATCHSGPLFTNQKFMNNGLDTIFEDVGRELISAKYEDLGKFKVPSLRNIHVTAPYMHDGRFETLEEVLNHYRNNVLDSHSLAPELNKNGQLGIPLTDQEIDDIIIYLETLTDYEFITNPLF